MSETYAIKKKSKHSIIFLFVRGYFSEIKLTREQCSTLIAECIAFQCRFNEQVFSPKSWKNFGADPYCRFREKRNFNFEKWRHRAEE